MSDRTKDHPWVGTTGNQWPTFPRIAGRPPVRLCDDCHTFHRSDERCEVPDE